MSPIPIVNQSSPIRLIGNKKAFARFAASEPKSQYNNYNDNLKEKFIDIMIESGVTRAKVGRDLGIYERVAQQQWKEYNERRKYPYKKSVLNISRKNTLTKEHGQYTVLETDVFI